MPLLIPYFRQQSFTEPPAMVHVVAREDVQWNRKLFKAPPLNVKPPVLELGPVGANLRKFPAAVSKPAQMQ